MGLAERNEPSFARRVERSKPQATVQFMCCTIGSFTELSNRIFNKNTRSNANLTNFSDFSLS